jgi:hypothetical protein
MTDEFRSFKNGLHPLLLALNELQTVSRPFTGCYLCLFTQIANPLGFSMSVTFASLP